MDLNSRLESLSEMENSISISKLQVLELMVIKQPLLFEQSQQAGGLVLKRGPRNNNMFHLLPDLVLII